MSDWQPIIDADSEDVLGTFFVRRGDLGPEVAIRLNNTGWALCEMDQIDCSDPELCKICGTSYDHVVHEKEHKFEPTVERWTNLIIRRT